MLQASVSERFALDALAFGEDCCTPPEVDIGLGEVVSVPQDTAVDLAPLLARLTCRRCLFEPEFVTRTSHTDAGFCVETRLKGVAPRLVD